MGVSFKDTNIEVVRKVKYTYAQIYIYIYIYILQEECRHKYGYTQANNVAM